jgi:hypothetical protein
MPELCVVYLVWGPLGRQPLERFVASYQAHPAGVDHRLVFVLNGVDQAPLRETHRALARELGADTLSLPNKVLDLEAYVAASERLEAQTVCFLNSYSQILTGGWLARLDNAAAQPKVGLVGATGSWGSQLDYLRYQLGLRSAYARVYGNREATRQAMLHLARARNPDTPARSRVVSWLGNLLMLALQSGSFTRFPAPHVRTNAFCISRELLLGLWPRRVRSKLGAYRLENGRWSLTARVRSEGLQPVVVGRDGISYAVEGWPESETFWQGNQANLLISDNRTEDYMLGDAERRALLSRYAWAERARPTPAVALGARQPEPE